MGSLGKSGKALVIGYGNPLRGDDGVGWRLAEQLAALSAAGQNPGEVSQEVAEQAVQQVSARVEIVTCHQLTPELAAQLCRFRYVLFIDASLDEEPGCWRVHALQPSRQAPTTFSHHLTPSALLALSQTLYGSAPPAHLLTIGGSEFQLPEQCSAPVMACLPAALQQAQALLASHS